MPTHCVTPMAVARRRAGKPWDARYTDPVNAKAEPAPCSNRPRYPAPSCGAINKRHPNPRIAIPEETTYLAPNRSSKTPATRPADEGRLRHTHDLVRLAIEHRLEHP